MRFPYARARKDGNLEMTITDTELNRHESKGTSMTPKGPSRQNWPEPASSLAAQAYNELRDKILKGDFALGAPLSRRKLARTLKMSFIPISDALQRLENEGLLESKPRVGTRVKIPTEDDVRDRYILREALETQAARLFSVRASEEEKQELVRMASQLDRLYEVCANETPDPDFLFSVHTYHLNLHLRIADATGSKALRDAIEMKQVLIFNWLYDTAARRFVLPQNFHSQLAVELTQGEPERADAEMRRHIQYGLDQVLEQIAALKPLSDNGWRLKKLER
jgi:DNA-binding GntR family transcriptional regulator